MSVSLVTRARSLAERPLAAWVARVGQSTTVANVVRRFAQARRDVGMLVGPLAGHVPAPLVARPMGHEWPAAPAGGWAERKAGRAAADADRLLAPRPMRIVEVVRETPSAVTVRLDPGEDFAWVAGQFLTVSVPVDGEPLRRAYSLSSRPGELPAFTVKRVPGGRASTWLVEHAAVGQHWLVRGPSGHFACPAGARQVLAFAAGSGVTPILPSLEAHLAEHSEARATLVFGNRELAEVLFRARIEALERAAVGRFRVRHVLETEDESVQAVPGRMDAERIAEALAEYEAWAGEGPDAILSCGPAPVMDAVRAVIANVPVIEERFHTLGERRAQAPARAPVALTIAAGGRQVETRVEPGRTVLEAGLAAGVAMPFSCTMGGCGACRVRVVSGAVVHDEPNGLSAAEVAGGYCFACVARPLGALSIEVAP